MTGRYIFSVPPSNYKFNKILFYFILVCKPSSHTTLYQYIAELEQADNITKISHRKWNGQFHELHTYRYTNKLLVKQGDDALSVNWAELTVNFIASAI